jgi:hypothetical protein
MALSLASIIGRPALAAAKVNARGFAAGIGGSSPTPSSSTPEFGRVGYLVLSDEELVLFRLEAGAERAQLGAVVERVPRGLVSSAVFDGSAVGASAVTLTFIDGEQWMLEAPRPSYRQAQVLVELLTSDPPPSDETLAPGLPVPGGQV